MPSSKISVIIPTRNEEETIASVIQGCQSHADEVLVVDGHSSDRTREVAEGLGARYTLTGKKAKGMGFGWESAKPLVKFLCVSMPMVLMTLLIFRSLYSRS